MTEPTRIPEPGEHPTWEDGTPILIGQRVRSVTVPYLGPGRITTVRWHRFEQVCWIHITREGAPHDTESATIYRDGYLERVDEP